jgi:coproporphyrinogen III oxidase-like Fe-S oxidoreductase
MKFRTTRALAPKAAIILLIGATASMSGSAPARMVARNGHGAQSETPLSGAERATEAMVMGLRLCEGISLDQIRRLSGLADPVDLAAAARLEALHLLTLAGDHLTITEKGMLLLDSILPEIIAA